ncbi:MAG: prephenate dehydratase domain-containing protein, partial [Desulfovibrionaceae bacterium]|nr:prephenate dehydratase domain-containing protein [Desulfovibrionaceae bacterium]
EQCGEGLKTNLPGRPLRPAASTARAAELAAGNPGAAAIGSHRLGGMFGLNVLAEHLEDLPDNWTRFLVIGPAPSKGGNRDKTSILFTTPDRPGALAGVLNTLAGRNINLTKLESRPFRGEKWKYVFFADLECDLSSAEYESLLAELKDNCHTLRVLGSYPAGAQQDSGDIR